MATNWYAWGNLTSNPNGTLNGDGTLKSGQLTYYSQLLFTAPPAVATTWNPNDQLNITLSGSNSIAAAGAGCTGGAPCAVRTTSSKSAGKVCVEVTATVISSNWDVGLSNASYSLSNGSGLGSDTNGIGYDPNFNQGSLTLGVFYNNGILSDSSDPTGEPNGAAVTICSDYTAGSFWVTSPQMRALGNPWNNSPTANPATGVGGFPFAGMTCPCFVTYQNFEAGTATLNTTGPFAVATPSGFSAWDTAVATTGRPVFILGANEKRLAKDVIRISLRSPE
jgi:hypothetical protein